MKFNHGFVTERRESILARYSPVYNTIKFMNKKNQVFQFANVATGYDAETLI